MGPMFSLGDMLAALRRRLGLILVIGCLGVPVALWYASIQPRVWSATAAIQIEAPQVTQTLAAEGSAMTPDNQLNLIQQQLMSRDNVAAIVDRFGLFPGVGSQTEKVAMLRGAVRIERLQDPALAWQSNVHPTGLLVTVTLDDPVMAANVANEMIDTIIAAATARAVSRANSTLDFILSEEARVGSDIDAIESQIANYREANLASLPEGLTAQRDRLNRLTEQRIAVDRDLAALAAGSDRLRADEVARQNALLVQERDVLLAAMAETEAAIAAAPEVERQLGAMTRALNQLEDELTVLTAQRTEAGMQRTLAMENQTERYEVLERALPPEFPVSASRRKVAMAVAMGIGAAGVALALGLELMNPAIRTAAQMQRALGVQPVIVVPVLRNRRWRRLRLGWWAATLAGLFGTLALLLKDRLLPLLGQARQPVAVRIVATGRQ